MTNPAAAFIAGVVVGIIILALFIWAVGQLPENKNNGHNS